MGASCSLACHHSLPILKWLSDGIWIFFFPFHWWIPGVHLVPRSLKGCVRIHPLLPSLRVVSSALRKGHSGSIWDDGDPCVGCELEFSVWASGAAMLRGPEPAQPGPATDPCAKEAHQHWGEAMGSRPQQATPTKGLWLIYAHVYRQFVFLLFLSSVLTYLSLCHFHLFALSLFYSQCIFLHVCAASLPFNAELTIVLIWWLYWLQ